MERFTVAQWRSLEALMVYTVRLESSVGVPVMRPLSSSNKPAGRSGVTVQLRMSEPKRDTSSGVIVALTVSTRDSSRSER